MMKKQYLFILLAATSLGFTSCSDDETDFTERVEITQENLNANDASIDPTRGRWEMPHLDSQYDYITHTLTDGTLNYAMEYCPQKFHSHWVAYRYDTNLARQLTGRSDAWATEPYYDSQKQYQLQTGIFPGYNRGHLLGSAERLCNVEANEQTFYMSNMSPMLGDFNSIYWGEIEDKVRDLWGRKVEAGDTLYVVKGGTIDDAHIRGYIDVRNTLGQNVKMAVPTHYFIACLYLKADGTARAIGFWMEHRDYKNGSAAYLKQLRRQCACSIDELEEKTGLDFFCNMPDWAENYVEANYNISAWKGL